MKPSFFFLKFFVLLLGYALTITFFWSAVSDWEERPDIITMEVMSRPVTELK